MAITILNNQPVRFRRANESTLEQIQECYQKQLDFCNKSNCDDTVAFQVYVDVEDSLGWAIKNSTTGLYDFVDSTNTYVTYSYIGYQVVATVQFSWTDVIGDGYSCTDGCYQICIFDLNESLISDLQDVSNHTLLTDDLITNGSFTGSGTGWDSTAVGIDATSEYSSNSWHLQSSLSGVDVGSSYSDVKQVIALDKGEYKIDFDITNYSDSLFAQNEYYSGFFLSEPPETNIIENIDADGSFTYDFNIDSASNFIAFVAYVSTDEVIFSISGINYNIDNIVLKRYITYNDLLDNIVLCSEPFCVGTHPCTKLLRWRNDDNAYNFDYESDTSFYFYMRLSGRLGRARYPKDKKNFENSNADNTILYSQTDKVLEYVTDHLPEYIHDALSIAIEHDTFEILDTDRSDAYIAYVSEEEDYDPDWEDELALAKVRFELKEATPDSERENSNC